MKDFWTKQILIRCDSFCDVYSIISHTPQGLLSVALSIWHQRLGHPAHQVFKLLVDSRFIPCSRTKLPRLCHACQMGKHMKFPFSLSNFVYRFPFEIVHYDVWTTPVASVGGIKYYVIFLDNYYQFLWVYPSRAKSDLFSKFLHFSAYVKNHFQSDIKSFQCDDGGEYNNHRFHSFFARSGTGQRTRSVHIRTPSVRVY